MDAPVLAKSHLHKRKRNHTKGLVAEDIAAAFLRLKGYRILARRFRAPVGEVDLIGLRFRKLVFFEVKLRQSIDEGLWAIGPDQQDRILNAAEFWLQRFADDADYKNKDLQFDVIVLAPWRFPMHIKNAFIEK